MALADGTRFGRYAIRSLLGAGGMGEVYLAQDTQLNRTVAIKFLHADVAADHRRMKRFMQEARAVSALNHPNILTIYEIGEADSTYFIVTEFIDGATLRHHMQETALELSDVLEIAIQVASALSAAHAAGIVHRDIKPENIMLRPDGYVKVLDFGLAKQAERQTIDDEAETMFNTDPGVVIGTVLYMSPEQARGLTVDTRTDIWSFGVVLYEMLARRAPFEGQTKTDVLVSILDREPIPLAHHAKHVPEELRRIVYKALSKNQAARYQTIEEMASDLKTFKQRLQFELERLRSAATDSILAFSSTAATTTTGVRRRRVSRKAIKSLAVLPFVNSGSDPNAEYLSDGITESLINNLAQLPQLRVMARSTVFRYKGQEVDLQRIGDEMGVHAVVTGRVSQRSDTLNIQTELVDVIDGAQLWGEQYNRKLSDIFEVQEEISREISGKLRLRLSGEEKKRLARRYTQNTEAYQFYLKGRFHWNKRTEENFAKAIEHFEHAIEKDPAYPLGYAGLADSYVLLGYYGALSPKETMPKAKAAALKAIELDETLPEAHVSLAKVKETYDWDWAGAEREYKRAIELNPSYAMAHHWYAVSLIVMGRHDEAISEMRLAQELDPLSLPIAKDMGWAFYFARKYDEAIEQVSKCIEADPNFVRAHILLGTIYRQKGMHYESISEFQEAATLHGGMTEIVAEFACTYAMAGKHAKAREILEQLKDPSKQKYVSPYDIATIYTCLGERDEAFDWLRRACEERSGLLVYLKVEPMFDSLRSDPRFAELVERVGLAS